MGTMNREDQLDDALAVCLEVLTMKTFWDNDHKCLECGTNHLKRHDVACSIGSAIKVAEEAGQVL